MKSFVSPARLLQIERLVLVVLVGGFVSGRASNYDGYSWVSDRIELVVDTSGTEALQPGDGRLLFTAVARAADEWNSALGFPILSVSAAAGPTEAADRFVGDGVSGIYFSREISPGQNFGMQFGYADSLRTGSGRFLETDLLFNPRHRWRVHDGPLEYDDAGNRVAELHRVVLHELGHLFGMTHPATDAAFTIMRSRMSDVDRLTPADMKDARRIADVLIARNRPRMTGISGVRRGEGISIVRIRGETNMLFARRVRLRVRSGEWERIVPIPRTTRWRKVLEVSRSQVRIELLYGAPDRSRTYRGDRKSF